MPNPLTTLGNIISKAGGARLEDKFNARIPDNQVYIKDPATGRPAPAPPSGEFVLNQSYLQVVINQMYVERARQLWVQRERLGAVWMSFDYNGATQVVPFMIGRQLLMGNVSNLPANAQIEYNNVSVGKVYPYNGGSLTLYLGLWSTPAVDWATATFSALDTIASKVGVAKSLSSVLGMIEALNSGISTILGLNQIQPVLNLYQEFQQPDSGSIAPLRPGYYVMIDAPSSFDPQYLRVLDNRLCYISSTPGDEKFYPFDELPNGYNFMLYNISSRESQDGAVGLFSKDYSNLQRLLINLKRDDSTRPQARQAYDTLQTNIVSSPDLTLVEQNKLLTYFRDKLDSDLKNFGISSTVGSLDFNATADRGATSASQAEFETHSAKMNPTSWQANPTMVAGDAAGWFDDQMRGVS